MVEKRLEPFPALTTRVYGYYDSNGGTLATLRTTGKIRQILTSVIVRSESRSSRKKPELDNCSIVFSEFPVVLNALKSEVGHFRFPSSEFPVVLNAVSIPI